MSTPVPGGGAQVPAPGARDEHPGGAHPGGARRG